MKTNLKLSSKMHIMIIVSIAVIVAGLVVGLACKFTLGSYFNYSGDWKSYDSVVISYTITDGDKVEDICEDAFKSAGLSYFEKSDADATAGGELVYKFTTSTSDEKLAAAATEIESKLETGLSTARFHHSVGLLGGNSSLFYGSIAVATAVVLQFIYFAIRYRLSSAFAALLANVHNVFVYLALLSLLRIPVTSAVFAFTAVTVLLTVLGTCFIFDKARKKLKDETFAKIDPLEQADVIANESFPLIWTSAVALAAAVVIICALLAISAGVAAFTMSPVFTALACIAASFYGLAFFTPSVYSRFKKTGSKKTVKAKKSV